MIVAEAEEDKAKWIFKRVTKRVNAAGGKRRTVILWKFSDFTKLRKFSILSAGS